MKTMWTLALLLTAASGGGDHARGVQLLAEGKFAEAVVALRAAAESAPADAELQYDLALALWRAGQAQQAEIAAEKAATLSDGALAPLRDGILGNIKMDEAHAKLTGEQPDLQAALAAAEKARDHFVHGAAKPGARQELVRNVERALKLIADIEKKIEEQKQQQKDDKDDKNKSDDDKSGNKDDASQDGDQNKQDQNNQDQNKQDQNKQDQNKDDSKQKGEPGKDKPEDGQDGREPKGKDEADKSPPEQTDPKDGKQAGEQGENQDKPEPKPGESKDAPRDENAEKKPDSAAAPKPAAGQNQDQPQPQPGGAADDGKDDKKAERGDAAAGAAAPPPVERELSPEETKRLLQRLEALLAEKAEMEKAQKAQRPRVKKDW